MRGEEESEEKRGVDLLGFSWMAFGILLTCDPDVMLIGASGSLLYLLHPASALSIYSSLYSFA